MRGLADGLELEGEAPEEMRDLAEFEVGRVGMGGKGVDLRKMYGTECHFKDDLEREGL